MAPTSFKKPFGSNSRLLNQGEYGSEVEPTNFGFNQAVSRTPSATFEIPSNNYQATSNLRSQGNNTKAHMPHASMTPVLKFNPLPKQFREETPDRQLSFTPLKPF